MVEKKVMLIDDQDSQRHLIQEMIEKLGYAVVAFDSPEEALYLLEGRDYPLIITDLMMPWMDGAEFCKRTKRLHPQTKIYALSGYIDAYDKKDLRKAGFDGLLSKPVSVNDLKATLDKAFAQINREIALFEDVRSEVTLPRQV